MLTVTKTSYSAHQNKNFTQKKVLKTSQSAALHAVRIVKSKDVHKGKCMKLHATDAEKPQQFLSFREATVPFIVTNALRQIKIDNQKATNAPKGRFYNIMDKLFKQTYFSPIGKISIISSDIGVRYIQIGQESNFDCKLGDPFDAASQIKAYFENHLITFNLPFDITVTDFTKKVLNATSKIPYGKTSTYGKIAAAINNPNAFRAVGGALNRNPLPIIIPCHRVLAKGSLGGFALGSEIKIKLLEHEEAEMKHLL